MWEMYFFISLNCRGVVDSELSRMKAMSVSTSVGAALLSRNAGLWPAALQLGCGSHTSGEEKSGFHLQDPNTTLPHHCKHLMWHTKCHQGTFTGPLLDTKVISSHNTFAYMFGMFLCAPLSKGIPEALCHKWQKAIFWSTYLSVFGL